MYNEKPELVVALERAIARKQREKHLTPVSYLPARTLDRAKEELVESFEDLVRKFVQFCFELGLSKWRR